MLKFLSIFKKSNDEQLNDNDYDFNETQGSVIDIQEEFESQKPALTDDAGGEQHKSPVQTKPSVDTTFQEIVNQIKIDKITEELNDMTADPQSPGDKVVEQATPPLTHEITKDEFDALPRKAEFIWEFEDGDGTRKARVMINAGNVQISAEFPQDAREIIPPEGISHFSIEQDGKKLVYPPVSLPQDERDEALTEHGEAPYNIDNLQPRRLEIDKAKIDRMSPEDLANELRTIHGQELIFYTGAGISMGGQNPVWGMEQLKTQLGLNDPDGAFFKTFTDPDQFPPAELAQKVSQFGQLLFEDASTPAHESIAQLVDEVPGAVVFTENIDLKHEAEGSRIKAVHMDSDPEGFDKWKAHATDAKVLITAGLRVDDRAANKEPCSKLSGYRIAIAS